MEGELKKRIEHVSNLHLGHNDPPRYVLLKKIVDEAKKDLWKDSQYFVFTAMDGTKYISLKLDKFEKWFGE